MIKTQTRYCFPAQQIIQCDLTEENLKQTETEGSLRNIEQFVKNFDNKAVIC